MLVISTFLTRFFHPPPKSPSPPTGPPRHLRGAVAPGLTCPGKLKIQKKIAGGFAPSSLPPPAAGGGFNPPSTFLKVWGINDFLQGVGGND